MRAPRAEPAEQREAADRLVAVPLVRRPVSELVPVGMAVTALAQPSALLQVLLEPERPQASVLERGLLLA